MGVRNWWIGLVAAAVIAAVTASSAPVVAAPEAHVAQANHAASSWSLAYDLPASLADRNVAMTASSSEPDKLDGRWSCNQQINIYYAASTVEDSASLVRQLEYPVRYLRALGYSVKILREVAYQVDYAVPTVPGDVLVIALRSDADLSYMHSLGFRAFAEAPITGGVIKSAKITVDADRGLGSDVLLHEIGHIIGLQHKPGTIMAEAAADNDSLVFDPAETAAVDCRPSAGK